MDGEQSKLAAKIVMLERDIELAKAKLFGVKNRWNRLYTERGQDGNAAPC